MAQASLVTYKSTVNKYVNLAVSGVLAPAEYLLESMASREEAQICFVVGPPRSGTTLLYELLVTNFQCGYFTNLAKRMFRIPVVATWICRGAIRQRHGAFDSRYGELTGRAAPSEAGRIWRWWMPYAAPYCLDLPGLSRKRMMRKIAAICRIVGQPMIVKNPILQSDIPLLLRTFPDAVFIHIERDWADNARSLMGLREKRTSDDDTGWVSLRPEGWQRFAQQDSLTQSCAQVMLSHQDIERHLGDARQQDRLIKISYEAICADPKKSLTEIEAFLARNKIAVTRRQRAGDSPSLETRKQPNDEIREKIQVCLERLAPQRAGQPD